MHTSIERAGRAKAHAVESTRHLRPLVCPRLLDADLVLQFRVLPLAELNARRRRIEELAFGEGERWVLRRPSSFMTARPIILFIVSVATGNGEITCATSRA